MSMMQIIPVSVPERLHFLDDTSSPGAGVQPKTKGLPICSGLGVPPAHYLYSFNYKITFTPGGVPPGAPGATPGSSKVCGRILLRGPGLSGPVTLGFVRFLLEMCPSRDHTVDVRAPPNYFDINPMSDAGDVGL